MSSSVTEEQGVGTGSSFHRRYFNRRNKRRHRQVRRRELGELLRLSRAARGRLEWMIFWEKNRKDVSLTARHFGITRKTFYKWAKRFGRSLPLRNGNTSFRRSFG